MGVVYSSILMFLDMKLTLLFSCTYACVYFWGGYLIYTLFGIRSQRDGIGHTAHFGGAIGGIMYTCIRSLCFSEIFINFRIIGNSHVSCRVYLV